MIFDDDTQPPSNNALDPSSGRTDETNETEQPLTEEERQAQEWENMMLSESQADASENLMDSLSDDSSIAGQDDINDTFDGSSPVVSKHSRTLDQNEIDSLIGDFFDTPKKEEELKGTAILYASKKVYYERLPMLEVVIDRLIRMMSTTLRNFTSTNVDVSLLKLYSIRFGDYLNQIPLPAMIGVFKAIEWENHGLAFVDSNLIYAVVDVLLGNRKGPLLKIEGRPYTTIERQLIQRLLRTIMFDLRDAFDPITQINFDFERLEINPAFATIARENNAGLIARLQIVLDDRNGILEFVFPYATIEPVRELLLQNFMGEKFGRDAIWERHLENGLWGTEVEIQATFPEQPGNLGDVLNWNVGSQLILNVLADDPVQLRCGNHMIGYGHMGKKSGKVAVQLNEILQKQVM